MVARLERELARLPHPPDLDSIVLRRSVGRAGVGRIRNAVPPVTALLLGLRELRVELLQLDLQLARLLDLLLALRAPEPLLVRTHLFLPAGRRAPALVGREQPVELLCAALSCEGGAKAVGVVTRCAKIDHERNSKS